MGERFSRRGNIILAKSDLSGSPWYGDDDDDDDADDDNNDDSDNDNDDDDDVDDNDDDNDDTCQVGTVQINVIWWWT